MEFRLRFTPSCFWCRAVTTDRITYAIYTIGVLGVRSHGSGSGSHSTGLGLKIYLKPMPKFWFTSPALQTNFATRLASCRARDVIRDSNMIYIYIYVYFIILYIYICI